MNKSTTAILLCLLMLFIPLVSAESVAAPPVAVAPITNLTKDIVKAIVDNDFPAFQNKCSVKVRLSISVDAFDQMHALFSSAPESKLEYLGTLSVGGMTVYLYKYPSAKKDTDLLLRFCSSDGLCTGFFIQ